MRISDWSSDVCSSDLGCRPPSSHPTPCARCFSLFRSVSRPASSKSAWFPAEEQGQYQAARRPAPGSRRVRRDSARGGTSPPRHPCCAAWGWAPVPWYWERQRNDNPCSYGSEVMQDTTYNRECRGEGRRSEKI